MARQLLRPIMDEAEYEDRVRQYRNRQKTAIRRKKLNQVLKLQKIGVSVRQIASMTELTTQTVYRYLQTNTELKQRILDYWGEVPDTDATHTARGFPSNS